MRRNAREFGLAAVVLLFAAILVVLYRHTLSQGQDFDVFYRAALAWREGINPYDVARAGSMIFKYPPWHLFPFLPLTFLSLEAAKATWAGICVFSLFWCVRECWKWSSSLLALIFIFVSFWGIWAVHFLDGQVSLPVLALALAFARRKSWVGLGWVTSIKVFPALSLLAFKPSPRQLAGLILVMTSLTAVFGVTLGQTPWKTIMDWREAATSGGERFDGEKIRARENQGIPALIMRAQHVSASKVRAETRVVIWVTLFAVLVGVLAFRALLPTERVIAWLAFAATLHPLAWFHGFVFAFPLAVIQWDRALRSKNRALIGLSLLGIAMITVVTRRTLGEWGETLELGSIKSWGVILLLILFRFGARASRTEQSSKAITAQP